MFQSLLLLLLLQPPSGTHAYIHTYIMYTEPCKRVTKYKAYAFFLHGILNSIMFIHIVFQWIRVHKMCGPRQISSTIWNSSMTTGSSELIEPCGVSRINPLVWKLSIDPMNFRWSKNSGDVHWLLCLRHMHSFLGLLFLLLNELDYCISEFVAKNWFFKNNMSKYLCNAVHCAFMTVAHSECRQTTHNNEKWIWLNGLQQHKIN